MVILDWVEPISPNFSQKWLREHWLYHWHYVGGPSGDWHHKTW